MKFNGYESDAYDYISKGQSQTGAIYYACVALLSISLVFGCLTVGIACCLNKGNTKCSCFLHINWMCLGCIGMIYLTIGMTVSTTSIIMMDICGVMEQVLTEKPAFDNILKDKAQGFEDMIDTCLFGDGNLKKILPIDDSMGSLDGFDKNLKLLSDVKELKTFTTYATFASNLVLREAGTMSSTD